MEFIIKYIIIGVALVCFCFKEDLGFGSDNFWICLLTAVLIIILWLPLVTIMIIVGAIMAIF